VDRRLVEQHLSVRDPVLSVEEAVVGREHEQRVAELARRAQLGDDFLDEVVDGEERLGALLVVLADRIRPHGSDHGAVADAARLVRDVGLVEARR
jgi:hypothetical protein